MKRKLFTLGCMLLLIGALQAQTWTGTTSTNWNTTTNWSPNTVPTATSNVIIPNTTNKPVLQNNVTVQGFTMLTASALDFNGFSLTISSSSDIRGGSLNNSNAASDIVISIGGTSASYFGSNTINDDIIINHAGTSQFYEAYQGGDTFNGNATFNYNGTGVMYTSYTQKSSFNGNLSINRTVAGNTVVFNTGYTNIAGNFSYTNTVGGTSDIGAYNSVSGIINGTINITATGPGNPSFSMYKLKNLTGGGTITVQNCAGVGIEDDTIKVSSISITGFTTASSDYLRRNSITGNFTFSDAATNTGGAYIDGNIITGNTVFGSNGTETYYEGYQTVCVYNGNTDFNITGTAIIYTSYTSKSVYNGNLTINRTGVGQTTIFNIGGANVAGNFSYSNNAGGASYLGGSSFPNSQIGGTINMNVTGTGNPVFQLNHISNLTAGGTINIQNSGGVDIEDDSIRVASFTVNGFTNASSDFLRRNFITGDLSFAEASTNTGGTYIDGNTITGNTIFSVIAAGSSTWYECYQNSCTYNGNVTFNRSGGTLNTAYSDTMYANQNVILNSASGIDINTAIQFGGNSNAFFEQTGTQVISMPRLVMAKTGGGSLTLNDSVTIGTAVGFNGGNLYTSATNPLVFPNNVTTHNGASMGSHVIGPVVKIGDDAFTFPVGGLNAYNPISMTAPSGNTTRFIAQYLPQNAGSDGYNTNSKAGSLTNVSKAGYWNVQRIAGASFPVLTFGFAANNYEQYPTISSLKIAQWNGSQWDDKGIGATTGSSTQGTIAHAGTLTAFGFFALANVTPTYFYVTNNPGAGPDGTPVKITAVGGYPSYYIKQQPSGAYTADSILLIPNGAATSFRLKDVYNVEKDDTSIVAPAAPTTYISANGNGTVNFNGWRNYVYVKNGSGEIIAALKDNGANLGNTTIAAYFSSSNFATTLNGNIYLKRNFKVQTQFAPAGTKQLRLYISKTEYNNLVAADPAAFPNGLNSLTITKYSGPTEDSLFNPIPGGNAVIIPNTEITIADLGTMYSLTIDVTSFSGFYISGNNANLKLCPGSTISLPSNVSGSTYQWQVDNGSGYVNVSNGANYGGATTSSLQVINAPSSFYNYKYRALVNGSAFSQVYTLKFSVSWTGAANTAWENPANWSCGVMPDTKTDITITGGKTNYPRVNSNVLCRSLVVSPGATVTIGATFKLDITGL